MNRYLFRLGNMTRITRITVATSTPAQRQMIKSITPAPDRAAQGDFRGQLDEALRQLVQQLALVGGVVAVVEPVLTHQMVVLRLDGRLVILLIRPGPGVENLPLSTPAQHLVVDELGPVIGVDSGDHIRHRGDERVEGFDHMGHGVVADRGGEHPPVVHVSEVHRAGELAFQRGPQ